MINIIETPKENVIAIEFVGGYQVEDEKMLENLFEEKLSAGITQINMLAKINKLEISKSSWKAMWDDGLYGIKHIKNCGKIAIVGNSKLEEFLIKIDNNFFGSEKKGRIEKYFHVDEMDKAMEWIE